VGAGLTDNPGPLTATAARTFRKKAEMITRFRPSSRAPIAFSGKVTCRARPSKRQMSEMPATASSTQAPTSTQWPSSLAPIQSHATP